MSSTEGKVVRQPQHAGTFGPNRLVRLIAIFKFCKAGLLLIVVLGALGLLRPSVAERAHEWAESLATSGNGRLIRQLVACVSGLSPRQLEAVGIAAFLFAGLFTTEGLGLLLGRRWAEYLTVIATLSLVPLEVYELTCRASPARFAALALNLAAAVYLIYRLRQRG